MGEGGGAGGIHDREVTPFRTKSDGTVEFTEGLIMTGYVVALQLWM
jgi:hypothetical protein